ncbi:acetyltransferase (GNAT) family protein [mine drainage metagenome]|uniref:Acetyltransferase (GNAT) family protein n=1 Tax=mine drainage metagenome TaxID=410659 RepID=A0A1J5QV72_9ZZZZ
MADPIVIRRAVPSDSEGIARVHVRSWQSAYRGLFPDEFLDGLRWEDWKPRWDARFSNSPSPLLYVAANPIGEVLGFAGGGPTRDEDLAPSQVYELYAIYLAPEIWRTGIGARLLETVLDEIPNEARWLSLWALTDNRQGRKFYESQGFKLDGATKMADIGGQQVEVVRYLRELSSVGGVHLR